MFRPSLLLLLLLAALPAFARGTLTIPGPDAPPGGGSLVARLDDQTRQQVKQPARARLMLIITLPGGKKVLSGPVAEADFSERGVVRLGRVAAGTYVLEVTAPGLGTATVTSIEIEEGKERTLPHPIRVDRPRAIRVNVHPPRDPHGQPWRVTVWHTAEVTDDSSVVVERVATSDTGTLAIEGQKAGRYTLILQASDESQYARRNLEVKGGADAIVPIDIATFRAKGRVTIGDRPVAAELNFGDGLGNEWLVAKANERGEFELLLTRDGVWPVFVHDGGEGIRSKHSVTVARDQPIEIRVPDTGIAGWVVGTDGKRLGKASLNILTDAGLVVHGVDPDGSFRISSLPPGVVKISAEGKIGQNSRYVEITLKEGARTEGVQLAIEGYGKLRGTLLSEGKPLAGARVTGYGIDGTMARVTEVSSKSDGEFEFSFQTSVTTIWLIVAAPGRTLQAWTVSPADTPVRLDLAPAGGTLRMVWTEKAKNPILLYNGTRIPTKHLMEWAQAHGRSLSGTDFQIPALAPGTYRFCPDTTGTGACVEGILARAGTLTLALE